MTVAWLSWQQQFGRRWVTQWAPYTPLRQCHRCGHGREAA